MDLEVEQKLANISIKEEKVSSISDGSGQPSSDANESEEREKFMKLVTQSRKLAEEGDITGALKLNEKALAIRYSEKLHKRIQKMKAFLAEQDVEGTEDNEEEDTGDMMSLGQGFMLHKKLHAKLYQHQKEGVLWMWSLHTMGKGGILADDMGLGKTIQVIAFLAGMFDMDKIKSVLIVVPLSVIPNWIHEFNKWTPGIPVMQFHGTSRKERERALAKVRSRGGVLMTTYGMVVTTNETLSRRHGDRYAWDYVILDEGHKIKNPTKTSKSINNVPARMRMILTGTPVQNNLKELWALFDYVHQGSLLGTMRTFKLEFEAPIIRARERDATAVAKRLGQEMAETLKGIIKPYFLRRTKAEVSSAAANDTDSTCMKMPTMTRKNDFVIWLHLTEAQQKIYQDFINLEDVKQLLMTKKSPLVALTVLKKICDHPRLLSKRACMQLGLDGDDFDMADLDEPEAYESAVLQINNIPDDVLVGEAGKMQILVQLLDSFKAEGRKTLVFSQSRRMLDIVYKVLTNRGHKCSRLDGTVTQLAERDHIVKKFQSDSSYSAFLLTVQVGGVGLTITSADRVIIYDPNWNPATDAQAVDRAYRIGQQKNVVVYRLITCGTVEEKIYRRQVFKDSITRQTTGESKNPYRYFTSIELRELFALDDPRFSRTQRQLEEMHAGQRNTDTDLDEHIAFLHSLDIFGISDHDLMFQQTQLRDDEEENEHIGDDEIQRDRQFIQYKIQQAQTLIAGESQNPFSEYEERSKGGMRYPPTAHSVSGGTDVRPSPLFSHVTEVPLVEVLESDEEMTQTDVIVNNGSSGDSTADAINVSGINDDEQERGPLQEVVSPPKKMHKPSMKSPAKIKACGEKRGVLQPLSTEEVKMRSPAVPSGSQKGPIITEELLISPDVSSPVIGLEKVDIRRRLLQEEEELRATSRSGSFPNSPLRSGASPKASSSSSVSRMNSPHLKSLTPNRNNSSHDILATESPQSDLFVSSPLNVSDARRKLSFVVADSPNVSSANQSRCDGNMHSNSSTPQTTLKGSSSILSYVVPGGGDDRLSNIPNQLSKSDTQGDKIYPVLADLVSPIKGKIPTVSSSAKKNKRRSVCVQQVHPRMGESSEEEDSSVAETRSPGHSSSEGEENKENLGRDLEEDEDSIDVSDEDNKENDALVVTKSGGRARIISESESSEGSCYEVPLSEDEDVQDSDADIKDEEAYVEAISVPVNVEDRPSTPESEPVEEEENVYPTEEEQERFQELVQSARQLYKQKNYTDSLLFVEQALTILQEPDLEAMAYKIRQRIASQSS